MNELSNIDSMSNADIMAAIGQSKGTNLPLLPKAEEFESPPWKPRGKFS